MILILVLRFYLARQNTKRDSEPRDTTYDDVYIEKDGEKSVKVDKVTYLIRSLNLIGIVLLGTDGIVYDRHSWISLTAKIAISVTFSD